MSERLSIQQIILIVVKFPNRVFKNSRRLEPLETHLGHSRKISVCPTAVSICHATSQEQVVKVKSDWRA